MKDYLSARLSGILSTFSIKDKRNQRTCVELLTGIIEFQTTNLTRIAERKSRVKPESCRKKYQRFLEQSNMLDMAQYAGFVLSSTGLGKIDDWVLVMDKTEWSIGNSPVNIFMLSAVYKKVSIPVCWLMLEKEGSSSTEERIQLLEVFIRLYGKNRIRLLLGDAEFIGEEWFSWLSAKKIKVVVAVRKNLKTQSNIGKEISISHLFKSLSPNGSRQTGAKILLGHAGYLHALRLSSGKTLILYSNFEDRNVLVYYKTRWFIEVFFQKLKTHGFNLEQLFVRRVERIMTMVMLVCLAYLITIQKGLQTRCHNPKKAHGYTQFSIFKVGLRGIIQSIRRVYRTRHNGKSAGVFNEY